MTPAPRLGAAPRIRDITVVGTPTEIGAVLDNHAAAGTLIAVTAPRPVAHRDPRMQVVIRLRDVAPPTRRPRAVRRRPTRVGIAVTAGILGALSAAAYLIGVVVEVLATYAQLILGGLVIIVIALCLLLRAIGGNGHRHCPGC